MNKLTDTRINVAQLLKEPIGATRAYTLEIPPAHLPPELVHPHVVPVTGRIHLLRTNRGILVEGELHGNVAGQCGRCLTDLVLPVSARLEEEFQPTVDVVRGSFLVVEEDDAALLINDQHILDLSEVMRQAMVLEVPMNQVCRPDCAGLCPICGSDLNEGPCECEPADVDPRWAQLGELLGDIEMIG